jgi:AmmeMemoRadiSam system protein B/AmmeMemoRadiSam system protein A
VVAIPAAMVLAAAAIALMVPGDDASENAAARSDSGGGRVRPSAIAGSWYPDRHSLIAAEVDRLVRATAAAPVLAAKPLVIVVPHAGWRYSAYAATAVFRTFKPGDFDRVVIVGPSHHSFFDGFSVPDVAAFRTPAGDVPLCQDAIKKIRDGDLVKPVAGSHEPEHSIEIELPFLQERLGSFCLVPILAGRTDPAGQAEMAARLARLKDGHTLFVFSSDFTHYGPRYEYSPFGPRAAEARGKIRDLDERAMALIAAEDAPGFRKFLDETGDTICGREGLKVMLEMLPRVAPKAKAVRLAYYTASDIPGFNDDSSVSYVAMAFADGPVPDGAPLGAPAAPQAAPADAPPLPSDVGMTLLRIARAAIRTELLENDDVSGALAALPDSSREALARLQATFVTIRKKGSGSQSERLRGCIGQVAPAYTLPESVVVSAAGAALQDPRFPPVKAEELPGLEVELTVLSTPRSIASWKEIALGRHGILLTKGGRRAVFLPEVPVQEGWTLEETLAHLSRKAGLPSDAWREGADFQVFEGQVFNEPR